MNQEDLMAKAIRALNSAKTLLGDGDSDGACNRAYYAMFDAARAALAQYGHQVGKTHHGALILFSDQFLTSSPP